MGILLATHGLYGGASGPKIEITNTQVESSVYGSGVAVASYKLENTGFLTMSGDTVTQTVPSDRWREDAAPGVTSSDYEVMATLNDQGGTGTGTFGSWLSLPATWQVNKTSFTPGTSFRDFTLEIRRKDTPGTILTSANIIITANAGI